VGRVSRSTNRHCLGDRTLGAFLEGEHDAAVAARIDAHVASCSTCRSLIALAARVGDDDDAVEKRVCAAHLLGASGGRIGQVLKGKWRLDALIGEGGMAEVYSATHRNGRKVAIKVLLPQLAVDPKLRDRFVDEGYIANLVGHPGVVEVHDDDLTEDGAPFLVMELLEGEVLADVIDRGALPAAESVRIAIALLDILAAAHAKGIVHRDIKPANVFRTTDGSIRLLDFGVARVDSARGERTTSGVLMGTPAFMAPEQARGRVDEIDARADIWSVGATLFAMLTGEKLRDRGTNQELLCAAASLPIAAIRERAPSIVRPIAAVLDRALAFDRRDRWQSAAGFARALGAIPARELSNHPVGRPRRRRREALTIGRQMTRAARAWPIATIALAVGILASALFLRGGASAAAATISVPKAAAEPPRVAAQPPGVL
jgi:serine/threonine protein kinase